MNESRFQILLVRYLSDEAAHDERRELERWLAASPDHHRQFAEARAVWQAAQPAPLESSPGVDQAWQEIAAKLTLEGTPARNPFPPSCSSQPAFDRFSWGRQALRIAAVLILIIGGVFLYRQYLQESGWLTTTAPAWEEIATANGQRRDVRLPDGSTVRLNVASTLRYRSVVPDSLRLILLEGEAFFAVVNDGRPFEVRTPQSSVRVLGTAFNIRARDNRTRVVVKEGRVALQALDRPETPQVVLNAGQMSVHTALQPVEPAQSVDADQRTGWLRRRLVFEQTPVAEVVAELQRVYAVRIVVADPALDTRTLTGAFEEDLIDHVLNAICLALNAQYVRRDDIYRIEQHEMNRVIDERI